jgi:hypothetical protein
MPPIKLFDFFYEIAEPFKSLRFWTQVKSPSAKRDSPPHSFPESCGKGDTFPFGRIVFLQPY